MIATGFRLDVGDYIQQLTPRDQPAVKNADPLKTGASCHAAIATSHRQKGGDRVATSVRMRAPTVFGQLPLKGTKLRRNQDGKLKADLAS